ncbi:MAG: hypothetical protein AB1656_23805 [Candidatus Omnitrophota bacterium]
MPGILIGIDFDNTIVCYDGLFHRAAMELGLIPQDVPDSKNEVRDYLRRQGREDDWTELQGRVYGLRMLEAQPYPGVADFFRDCCAWGVKPCIVSFKTRYPVIGPRCDLHQSAQAWLEENGFYEKDGIGLSREQVFFELTLEKKLERIAELGCSWFIDDLPECLRHAQFPSQVKKVLFDPHYLYSSDGDYSIFHSWEEIISSLRSSWFRID